MMVDNVVIAISVLVGSMLGIIYFAGLWWTVSKGIVSNRPAFWFLISFLVRTGLVVAGFFWVSHGGLSSLIVCMMGFLLGRQLVLHMQRKNRRLADRLKVKRHET